MPCRHKARRIEQRNGSDGQHEYSQQLLAGALGTAPHSRERPKHQQQPKEQAQKEQDLPEPTKVNVFVSLVTEPEIRDVAEALVNREPLSGHGPSDDHNERHEKDIDSEALIAHV